MDVLNYRRGEKALAWYLSGITGFIDAIGFIHLGGFFLSFMSGNTTRMTASMAEGKWDIALKAAGLMGLFLLGVMVGALIQRLGTKVLPEGRPREAVLCFVLLATLVAAVVATMGGETSSLISLSFAVGAMNSVFEKNGEVAISLTYATGTLVKTAQHFVGSFFGEDHRHWLYNFLLWASLASGSILGGLCYQAIGLMALWGVAGLVFAGFAAAMINRERRRRNGLGV